VSSTCKLQQGACMQCRQLSHSDHQPEGRTQMVHGGGVGCEMGTWEGWVRKGPGWRGLLRRGRQAEPSDGMNVAALPVPAWQLVGSSRSSQPCPCTQLQCVPAPVHPSIHPSIHPSSQPASQPELFITSVVATEEATVGAQGEAEGCKQARFSKGRQRQVAIGPREVQCSCGVQVVAATCYC